MDKLFEVKTIIEQPRIDSQGEVSKIHKVSAITKSGDRFTLDIADADFDLERVKDALTARALELEAIRAI